MLNVTEVDRGMTIFDSTVKELVIEVHEKRDNPNAYGHYDVRIVATVLPRVSGADANVALESTYAFLAEFVKAKCDEWETSVIGRYEIKQIEKRIASDLNDLKYCCCVEDVGRITDMVKENISHLPEEKRDTWNSVLEARLQEQRVYVNVPQ